MKALLFSLSGAATFLGLALTASAQLTQTFTFDAVSAGTEANAFATSTISFHQAHYVPKLDEFGDPIVGTSHWEVDTVNDLLTPVTVESPLTYDRGPAPSGLNALQALWQPILIQLDRPYQLQSFSAMLDHDTFGFLEKIVFIRASSIVSELLIDQTVPGYLAAAAGIGEISGIVLPSGAFYDNLALSLVPVPEPSTYGLLAASACVGLVALRRIRRKKTRE